jgi:uncharacterized protein YcfJ
LPIILPIDQAKTCFASVVSRRAPVLDTKKPPKQQCRIEGTIFVPKNAALTKGGENGAIFGTKLVSKTATKTLSNLVSQTGALLGYQ